MNDTMATNNKTQEQVKADKRAAALRENLKKRKSLMQDKKKTEDAKSKNSE